MSRKIKNMQLMEGIILLLIKEWGYDSVHRCVLGYGRSSGADSPTLGAAGNDVRQQRKRLSPIALVAKTELIGEKRVALETLATRFESKDFLPTISDVRNFLELRGKDTNGLTQRAEAFRKILVLLLDLSVEELLALVEASVNTGPAELGPLSDAIKAASSSKIGEESKLGDSRVDLLGGVTDEVNGEITRSSSKEVESNKN